jgi:hypothetical protein
MFTQISFDYTNRTSKWYKYDIVILIEFGLTFDRKYDTIIDMAMHGLGESDSDKIIRNLINDNSKNDKKILIIIDGYNDTVGGQCRELDNVLNSSSSKLDFDLIVTRKSNIEIERNDQVTFLKIIGCNLKEKQRDNRQIESRISKILTKPIILVKSIIKELYRNKFAKYNPIHIDLGFQFNMNTWFPIKLLTEYNREENDPFQLIANGLKRNADELKVGSLVVITGK